MNTPRSRIVGAVLLGLLLSHPSGFPQSIPPNFGAYNLHPLYNPDAVLGWAETRIAEKLGRGMIAVATKPGEVYLGWRLVKSDPADLAFNLYRSSDGAPPVKLNEAPLRQTTDFVDTSAPVDRENAWWVRPLEGGREGPDSMPMSIPRDPDWRSSIATRTRIRAMRSGFGTPAPGG
jgi:hypothetical protein